tara:strand:+ start:12885 stop:13205 length:321 start_codon:yes stop_codon:yes gene_type:complete
LKLIVIVESSKKYNVCKNHLDICESAKNKYPDSFITYCVTFKVPNVNNLVLETNALPYVDRVMGYGNCLAKVFAQEPYLNKEVDILITMRNEEEYLEEKRKLDENS